MAWAHTKREEELPQLVSARNQELQMAHIEGRRAAGSAKHEGSTATETARHGQIAQVVLSAYPRSQREPGRGMRSDCHCSNQSQRRISEHL